MTEKRDDRPASATPGALPGLVCPRCGRGDAVRPINTGEQPASPHRSPVNWYCLRCKGRLSTLAGPKGAPEMTESDWLRSDDPHAMLNWITCAGPSGDGGRDLERWRNRPSDGKLRAVCHALPLFMPPVVGGRPFPWAPADWLRGFLGTTSQKSRALVASLLRDVVGNPWRPLFLFHRDGKSWRETELAYAPVRWLTPTALGIARRVYDERDFDALPVLADALFDAGCHSEDLLRHLRGQERCRERNTQGYECRNGELFYINTGTSPCYNCKGSGWVPLRGPHVRGCWALDLILGKDGVP